MKHKTNLPRFSAEKALLIPSINKFVVFLAALKSAKKGLQDKIIPQQSALQLGGMGGQLSGNLRLHGNRICHTECLPFVWCGMSKNGKKICWEDGTVCTTTCRYD